MLRSMNLINEQGDITVTWDEAQDERIKELIQKKMDEGYAFFTLEGEPPKPEKVLRVTDLGDKRTIVIKDEDADRLFKEGLVGVIKEAPQPEVQTRGRAKNAEEAAGTSTVAVKPRRGG